MAGIYVGIKWTTDGNNLDEMEHYEFPNKEFAEWNDALEYIKKVLKNTPSIHAGRIISYRHSAFTRDQRELAIGLYSIGHQDGDNYLKRHGGFDLFYDLCAERAGVA